MVVDDARGCVDDGVMSFPLVRRSTTAAAVLAVAATALLGPPPAGASATAGQLAASATVTASATGSPGKSKREAAVLRRTNKARSSARMCGTTRMKAAPALKWNRKLARSAHGHSADMAERDYFSHNSPEGATPFQRIRATGYVYRAAGENIAAGGSFVTAKAVVRAWLDSPGHCRNLMNPTYRHLGVARSKGPGKWGIYWTQNFGRKAS